MLSVTMLYMRRALEKQQQVTRLCHRKCREKRIVLDAVQQCKHRWLGHALRHDSLLVSEGRMIGQGRRWCKRLTQHGNK